MPPSETLRKARVAVPITALIVALTTLFGCVIIAKLNHVYLNGMFWPFFSNTGRDKPAYYLFCAGLTTTAVLLIATYTFNHQFQSAVLRKAQRMGSNTTKHYRMAAMTRFAGTISVFGLSLLAFFDTATYPSSHQITAYWFFAWSVVATIMNTFVSKRIYDLAVKGDAVTASNYVIMEAESKSFTEDPNVRARKRHRTYRIQLAFNLIFFVAFLIYIPWNIAFPSRCPALTVQECLDRDLGERYCTVTMRDNDVDTKLINCENNLTKPQIRAFGQLVCILTLIGYCVTFVAHDYEDAERDDAQPLHPL